MRLKSALHQTETRLLRYYGCCFRDIAVINKMTCQIPDMSPIAATSSATFPVRVEAPQACPRYLGRVFTNVNVKANDTIMDAEKNYVVVVFALSIQSLISLTLSYLKMGQPLHAFDLDHVDGAVVVRMGKEGEKLTLLDGNEITLKDDVLVIADENKH